MRLHLGLVHYPVYDKNGERIASAVTPVDIHDLARIARTYGAGTFQIITPLKDQQELVDRIRTHWTAGFGASYNPDRREAVQRVAVADTLEDGIHNIHRREGEAPFVVATDAGGQQENMLSFSDMQALLRDERVVFLLFGTAWGLDRDVLQQADAVLEPIRGIDGYNHLPVRAAAAIIVDRLVGVHP